MWNKKINLWRGEEIILLLLGMSEFKDDIKKIQKVYLSNLSLEKINTKYYELFNKNIDNIRDVITNNGSEIQLNKKRNYIKNLTLSHLACIRFKEILNPLECKKQELLFKDKQLDQALKYYEELYNTKAIFLF